MLTIKEADRPLLHSPLVIENMISIHEFRRVKTRFNDCFLFNCFLTIRVIL